MTMIQHIDDRQYWDLPDGGRHFIYWWLMDHGYVDMDSPIKHRASVGALLELLDEFGYVELTPNFTIGGYDTRLLNAEEEVAASGHAAQMCDSLWKVVVQVIQNHDLMNLSTCERWERKYSRWLTKQTNPDEQQHDSTSISGR